MSRRSRANRSIGNKLNSIDSRISSEEKAPYIPLTANTVNNAQLAPDSVSSETLSGNAVTDDHIDSGAISGASLSSINEISTEYNLDLIFGDGGHLTLDGDQYPLPAAGEVAPLTMDSDGNVVLGTGTIGGGGTGSTIDWTSITSKPALFPSSWSQITGIPATFAPAAHSHGISEITGLTNALSLKSDTGHKHPASDLIGANAAGQVPTYDGTNVVWAVPTGGGGTGGTVAAATTTTAGIVELATTVETLTGTDAVRAVTPTGVAAVAATKAGINQAFVAIDTDGMPYFDPGMDFTNAVPLYPDDDGVPYMNSTIPWNSGTGGGGGTGGTVAWANITNIPNTFTPSAHTHVAADITGGPNGMYLSSNGTTAVWVDPPAGGTGGTVSPATDTAAGVVELATNAETLAGSDATRAVTPAANKYTLDSRFNAFTPSWNSVSGKPVYTFDTQDNVGGIYKRLFYINGNNPSGGAYVTFIISGMGDWSPANKGTAIVHFGQRNTGVSVKIWGFGTDITVGDNFYTRAIGTSGLEYELWMKVANFTFGHQVTVLSQSHTSSQVQVYMDGDTTSAPTGLSAAYPILDMENLQETQAGRLGKTMTNAGSGYDFNNQTIGGWSAGYNTTNSPLGDTAGYMTQTIAIDDTNALQIAHRTTASRLTSFKREKLANVWQPWRTLEGEVFNVLDYGAKGDGQYINNAVVSGTTITSSSGPFRSGDVGKLVLIGGTVATITAYNSNTSITISASVVSATHTTNSGYVSTGAPTSRLYWGSDDGAAIQNALNDAAGGGVVLIPAHRTYTVNRMLYVYNNTRIEATGAYLRKFAIETGFIWNDNPNTSFPANASITMGESNITINGGTWDSMGQHSQYAHNTFTFAHCHDIIVCNLIMKHNAGSHFIEFDGVTGGKVINVEFQGYRKLPLSATGGDREYAECIQVDYGDVTSNIDTDPCRNITVAFCSANLSYDYSEMGYPGKLVGSHSHRDGGTPHETIHVYNNHIYGCLDTGIRAYQWNDVIISNNQIDNCGLDSGSGNRHGITVDTYKYNAGTEYYRAKDFGQIVISNNIIRKPIGSGIYFRGESYQYSGDASATEQTPSEVSVTNNIIWYPGSYGIYGYYAYNSVVTGNTIAGSSDSSIYMANAQYPQITNNKIVFTAGQGIELSNCNQSNIQLNYVNTPRYCGVMIYSGSTDCSIQNNFIRGAASGATGDSTTTLFGYGAIYVSGSSHYTNIMFNTIRPGTGNYNGSGSWVAPTNGWGGIHVTSSSNYTMHFGNDLRGIGQMAISGSNTFTPGSSTALAVGVANRLSP